MEQLNKNVEKIMADRPPMHIRAKAAGEGLRLTTAMSILHTGLPETACLPDLRKDPEEQSEKYKVTSKLGQMLKDGNKDAWERLLSTVRHLLVRNLPLDDVDNVSDELVALTTSMCITPYRLQQMVQNPDAAVRGALEVGDMSQLAALYFIGFGRKIVAALGSGESGWSEEVALTAAGLVGFLGSNES